LLVKTHFTFYASLVRTLSPLFSLEKSKKTALKQLSRLSPTSMRGQYLEFLLSLAITNTCYSVRTGEWVGDCFIYTNAANRLNYLVGDQTYTVSHFDQPMYILGYLPRDGRVYLADKDVGVTSYALSLSVVEYQTLVLRGDLDAANEMLPDIEEDQRNKIARFLEGQGYKEQALEVATDPEHRFELALALNELSIALELARTADVEHKWKIVGDAALTGWDLALAEECFTHAHDLGSLLLLHSSTGNTEGLRSLTSQARAAGANNIAFTCLWQLSDTEGCIELLTSTGRTAEAVLFAQTYAPSQVPKVAGTWRKELQSNGKSKVAKVLAIPPGTEDVAADDDMFPEWEEWLRLEDESKTADEEPNLIDVDEAEDVNGAEEVFEEADEAPAAEIEAETEAETEVTTAAAADPEEAAEAVETA